MAQPLQPRPGSPPLARPAVFSACGSRGAILIPWLPKKKKVIPKWKPGEWKPGLKSDGFILTHTRIGPRNPAGGAEAPNGPHPAQNPRLSVASSPPPLRAGFGGTRTDLSAHWGLPSDSTLAQPNPGSSLPFSRSLPSPIYKQSTIQLVRLKPRLLPLLSITQKESHCKLAQKVLFETKALTLGNVAQRNAFAQTCHPSIRRSCIACKKTYQPKNVWFQTQQKANPTNLRALSLLSTCLPNPALPVRSAPLRRRRRRLGARPGHQRGQGILNCILRTTCCAFWLGSRLGFPKN